MVSAAPLVPRSSLTTCTSRICRRLDHLLDLVVAQEARRDAALARLLGRRRPRRRRSPAAACSGSASDSSNDRRHRPSSATAAAVGGPTVGGRRRRGPRSRPRSAGPPPASASADLGRLGSPAQPRRPAAAHRPASGAIRRLSPPATSAGDPRPRSAAAAEAPASRRLSARAPSASARLASAAARSIAAPAARPRPSSSSSSRRASSACMLEQALPVGDGDLVVVRMDFAEGEEAVPVAAVFDEGGLQAGLYPDHLGEVDVALELALGRCLDVEILQPVTVQHHHAGFFRVRGVDQHTLGHLVLNSDGPPGSAARIPDGTRTGGRRNRRVGRGWPVRSRIGTSSGRALRQRVIPP